MIVINLRAALFMAYDSICVSNLKICKKKNCVTRVLLIPNCTTFLSHPYTEEYDLILSPIPIWKSLVSGFHCILNSTNYCDTAANFKCSMDPRFCQRIGPLGRFFL